MADVMQVNSIRFHVCLYLSIFESSSFFSISVENSLSPYDCHRIPTVLLLPFESWEKPERICETAPKTAKILLSHVWPCTMNSPIWTLYINGEKLYYWLKVVPQSDCCRPRPSLQHPLHPCPSVHQAARSLVMQECQRTAAAVWESNRRECSCLVQACSLCKQSVQAVPIIQRNLNLHHQHLR